MTRKYYKWAILLLMVWATGFTVAAQSASQGACENVVPVEIEGVYILSFDKDDVIECNRPGVGCFDYPQKDYFFTLYVNGKIHLKSFNDIRMALLNPKYANLEVFSFPPFNYYSDSILKAQNITLQTQSVSLGKEYYLLDGDSTNLYKYMHFKASALRTLVFSDYLDKNRIPDLQTLFDVNTAASIDLNAPCVYNYILYDIEIIYDSSPEWLTPFHFNYSN